VARRGYWTADRIRAEIRRWAREHDGEPPKLNEWRRQSPRWTRERPSAKVVLARYGSWNAAIEAAGFEPRVQGDQPSELCKRGLHELTGDNVWQSSTNPGLRQCRACRNDRRELQRRDAELAQHRVYCRKQYEARVGAGLCPRCGREPPADGRVCCPDCLAYLREADTRRRRAA
jgi:hypothetical protein